MVLREAISALHIVAATCLEQYPAPVTFVPAWSQQGVGINRSLELQVDFSSQILFKTSAVHTR